MKNIMTLVDTQLFNNGIECYKNSDLIYVDKPNSVGITTEYENEQKKFIVYVNDEMGNIEFSKEYNDFKKTVFVARKLFTSQRAYYQGIINDYANIRKMVK